MGSGERQVNRRIVSGRTLGRRTTGIIAAVHHPLVGEDKLDVLRVNLHTRAVLDPAGGKSKSMIDHDDLFTTQLSAAGFTPPELPADLPAPAAVEAADRASRYWTSPHVGVLRPGSEAHKREVCRMFHETFNPYRPAIIAWPKLSPVMLQRVTSLPIWDIAVHTESRARLRFASYANRSTTRRCGPPSC